MNTNNNKEIHLDVYFDRQELHLNDDVKIYYEGLQSVETKCRYTKITNALEEGFLENKLKQLGDTDFSGLSEKNKNLLKALVNGITSEVGRGLVGVAFLQLVIKSITPEQSIRLHKGSARNGSFSWIDGISMRTLDSHYTAKFLKTHGLLNLNKYGSFMTRSLAENYKKRDFESMVSFMMDFYNSTDYSARAFEIVIHGYMQAMAECHFTGDLTLVPMSQMRSANKKHGNIGDVEMADGRIIVEAWDAKYGKPYLRDELEDEPCEAWVSDLIEKLK